MVRSGARLSGEVGDLMDVSLTGALLLMRSEVPVGGRHVLRIVVGAETLELECRAVRVRPVEHQHPAQWEVGVTFVDVTPELRRAIPSMVAKLTATLEPRPRTRS